MLPAILGPEMAAPILWKPGIFAFFLQENPYAHTILRFRGGGIWVFLGGKCPFYFYGRGDSSDILGATLGATLGIGWTPNPKFQPKFSELVVPARKINSAQSFLTELFWKPLRVVDIRAFRSWMSAPTRFFSGFRGA